MFRPQLSGTSDFSPERTPSLPAESTTPCSLAPGFVEIETPFCAIDHLT